VKQKLRAYAQSIRGVDVAAYQGCVDSGKAAEIVRADQRLGAAAQVRGTPTVFINGTMLPGLRSPADLHAAIEQAVRTTNQAGNAATKTGGTE
jgi:protein-disulfide isomerase